MRLLHTSDWHVGRTFHGHSTLPALRVVLEEMATLVRQWEVDAVLVAGDVFDTALPTPEAYAVLREALHALTNAGAQVVLTSGNHDSPARLGFLAPFTGASGVHLITRPAEVGTAITLRDAHGPVHIFGIPYLEPTLLSRATAGQAPIRNQQEAMDWALARIWNRVAPRQRTVVVAHTFAAGPAEIDSDQGDPDEPPLPDDAPRDFTRGGIDLVSPRTFAPATYAALGHIHSRATLAEHIRYSGAPLHYSFAEGPRPRGGWLVELDAHGLQSCQWLDLPVPRGLVELVGPLDGLLSEERYEQHRQSWVRAVLTDAARPLDALNRLRVRFPHCAQLVFEPEGGGDSALANYSTRVRSAPGVSRRDEEVADEFAAHVRSGERLSEAERELLSDVITTCHREEQSE